MPAGEVSGRPVCDKPWCGYSGPHVHTTSASTTGPTFDALLADPQQQLDERGEVLASVLAQQRVDRCRLTTGEREHLSHEMVYGYDAIVSVVEQILQSRLP